MIKSFQKSNDIKNYLRINYFRLGGLKKFWLEGDKIMIRDIQYLLIGMQWVRGRINEMKMERKEGYYGL